MRDLVFRTLSPCIVLCPGILLPSCHNLYTEVEGLITSPNYPAPYPASLACTYDIARHEQDEPFCGVRITCVSFYSLMVFKLRTVLEIGHLCRNQLQILISSRRMWTDSAKRITSQSPRVFRKEEIGSVARFRGRVVSFWDNNCPQLLKNWFVSLDEYAFQTEAEYFRLVFVSGAKNESTKVRKGFQIRYSLLDDCRQGLYWSPPVSLIPDVDPFETQCFTQVTESKGTINTPYFPRNYPNNMDCVYEFLR